MAEMYKQKKHVALLVGVYNKEVVDEPLCVIPAEQKPFSDAPPGSFLDVPPGAKASCDFPLESSVPYVENKCASSATCRKTR